MSYLKCRFLLSTFTGLTLRDLKPFLWSSFGLNVIFDLGMITYLWFDPCVGTGVTSNALGLTDSFPSKLLVGLLSTKDFWPRN